MIDALEVFALASFLIACIAFGWVAYLDRREEWERLPKAQNVRKLLRSGSLRRMR